ncbi:MAG: tetratricopeptide repeat protein [Promethearchaeota archaeon]
MQMKNVDTDLTRRRAEKLLKEGRAAALSNEYARAVEFLQVSARMYNRLDEIDQVIKIAYELADVYASWARLDEAVKTLNLVIKMQRAKKDINETVSLHHLARIYHTFGKDDRALKALRRAARLFREREDKEEEILTMQKIAEILCSGGRYSESIETYKRALDLIEEHGLNHLECECLEGIANTYKVWGRGNQAVEYFRRSLAARCVNNQNTGATV